MPSLSVTHVEVYLFRRRGRRVEFLALRRSPGRRSLPGVWQPVTGKTDARERALDAASREVFEETGLRPKRWWGLETLTVYFDSTSNGLVALPLYAAEVAWGDRVRLSEEHDAYRFVPAAQARRMFLWATQARGLEAVRREVLAGGARARALELTDQIGAQAGAARRLPRSRSGPSRRRA